MVDTVRTRACGAGFLAVLVAVVAGVVAVPDAAGPPPTPWVVAHRGASAYAPENTVPAFALAAEQHATFVEFDLQRTKDGALVILHDLTLERTTDVEEVFPDRGRQVVVKGETRRQWPLADFTLAEVRRLDAGKWFDAKFAGTRVPTFAETIAALRGKTRALHRAEVAGPVSRHRGRHAGGTEDGRAGSTVGGSADAGAAAVVHGQQPADPRARPEDHRCRSICSSARPTRRGGRPSRAWRRPGPSPPASARTSRCCGPIRRS